jgi:hypothetical protein
MHHSLNGRLSQIPFTYTPKHHRCTYFVLAQTTTISNETLRCSFFETHQTQTPFLNKTKVSTPSWNHKYYYFSYFYLASYFHCFISIRVHMAASYLKTYIYLLSFNSIFKPAHSFLCIHPNNCVIVSVQSININRHHSNSNNVIKYAFSISRYVILSSLKIYTLRIHIHSSSSQIPSIISQ